MRVLFWERAEGKQTCLLDIRAREKPARDSIEAKQVDIECLFRAGISHHRDHRAHRCVASQTVGWLRQLLVQQLEQHDVGAVGPLELDLPKRDATRLHRSRLATEEDAPRRELLVPGQQSARVHVQVLW